MGYLCAFDSVQAVTHSPQPMHFDMSSTVMSSSFGTEFCASAECTEEAQAVVPATPKTFRKVRREIGALGDELLVGDFFICIPMNKPCG